MIPVFKPLINALRSCSVRNGGFDLKFGLKIYRHFWMPPALILTGSFSYVAWRIKYDLDYCYEMMSWCTEYDHLVNLIWKISWLRPNFKEELFRSYQQWLDEANQDPEAFIQNINFYESDLFFIKSNSLRSISNAGIMNFSK